MRSNISCGRHANILSKHDTVLDNRLSIRHPALGQKFTLNGESTDSAASWPSVITQFALRNARIARLSTVHARTQVSCDRVSVAYDIARVESLTYWSRVQRLVFDHRLWNETLNIVFDQLQELSTLLRQLPRKEHLCICQYMAHELRSHLRRQ